MAVYTATGKITNLFMMLLNETTSDVFYDQPDIYLKCIKAGAKYLQEKPYPENNQDIKFKYGYHPEKVTNREEWWAEALKPIKAELKDHYGPGFTKKIKGIVWTLADEGNTALENMKQFISTGTCEQYEAFLDGIHDNSDVGGLYIDDSIELNESYSSQKKYVIKGDNATWVGFYHNKTDAKRCLKPFTGKNQVILAEETLPETVTQEITDEYPIVVNIRGGNSTWSDDIQRNLYMNRLGIKCYNKQFYPVYLIKDEQAVRNSIKNVVYEMHRFKQPASSCIGYKIDWSVGCWNIKWSSIDKNKYDRPICQNCGAPLSKKEVETYGDTCEACALDDIGRDRHYDGPDVGDLFESIIKEGTNTEKKNYIDIKGEKAPLDWDRIDDKIEKIGFGKDLYECILREDTIKSWYEPFKDFCYQIYNGGVSQPLGLNPHYYKDICTLLDELPSGGIMKKIYLEKNIPDEWAPTLEKFVKEVCELCNAVSEADFYKSCNYCDGSGEEYIMDEDEDGNDHSYYDTCDMCGGTGFLSCHIDEMDDIEDAKSCLNKTAQEYWDDLDNNVLEYCAMFRAIEGKE